MSSDWGRSVISTAGNEQPQAIAFQRVLRETPAFVGIEGTFHVDIDHQSSHSRLWIPAFAGMTVVGSGVGGHVEVQMRLPRDLSLIPIRGQRATAERFTNHRTLILLQAPARGGFSRGEPGAFRRMSGLVCRRAIVAKLGAGPGQSHLEFRRPTLRRKSKMSAIIGGCRSPEAAE